MQITVYLEVWFAPTLMSVTTSHPCQGRDVKMKNPSRDASRSAFILEQDKPVIFTHTS